MAARRAVLRHRSQERARQEQETALQQKTDLMQEKRRRAEAELANLSLFGGRRRRELEGELRSARESLQILRFERKALPAPEPEPGGETLRLQSMRTSGERRQEAAARRRAAAQEVVARMEADGLFLERRRDPALARRWEDPPERPLLFVVASPAHVPDEESLVREWHHVAVQDPSSGPEGLKALRELYPDAVMAPAPGLRENWPKDVPALDPASAEHEFRDQGLAGHIDMVEGRVPEPEPGPVEESRPEPEEPKDDGPSFDPF